MNIPQQKDTPHAEDSFGYMLTDTCVRHGILWLVLTQGFSSHTLWRQASSVLVIPVAGIQCSLQLVGVAPFLGTL